MAEGRRRSRTNVTNRRKSAGRWSRPVLVLGATLLTCGIVPAAGCKTGSSFSKPTWPTFGSLPKKKDTADDLATAPPYAGDVKKPSEAAKPYPTTSTPNGYVLTGSTSPAAGQTATNPASQTQAAVVYGTTPPAAVAPSTQPSPAVAATAAPAGIGAQVGPYSGMSADSIPPPGQPLPALAPTTTAPVAGGLPQTAAQFQTPGQTPGQFQTPGQTPAESVLPGAAYSSFPSGGVGTGPAARLADARTEPVAAPPQPSGLGAAAVGGTAAAVGSRYADSAPSRFSAEGTAPQASPVPAAAPADPLMAPEQRMTPQPAVPASAAPLGQPATAPAQPAPTPGLLQPGAAPVRRPETFWRPGGTSSYRPSQTILADDSPAPGPAVKTASFEDVEPGTVRQ